MEKKIEKIEGAYDLPVIKKKLNQVIDYLNSESRPEGNYKLTIEDLEDITKLIKEQNNDSVSIEYLMQYCGYPNIQPQAEEKSLKELEDNYLYSLRTANKPMSQDQEEEKIEYFDKGDKVRTYKSLEVSEKAYSEEPTVEDVYIEDTPEEKEEWEEEFMDVLETFKDEVCSNFFASSKPLTDFIQQLLEEREREVEKNLFKRLYSARSKKEFREMLSKLTTK